MLRSVLSRLLVPAGLALLITGGIIADHPPVAWARPAGQNTPAITLSPATAVPNQAIGVTGKYFTIGGNATISTITIGGVAVDREKINFDKPVTVDSGGSFVTNLIIPVNSTTLNSSSASISVTDSSGVQASATLTISVPSISVSPSSSRMGSTVTVTGTNFPKDNSSVGSDNVPEVTLEYQMSSNNYKRVATVFPNSLGGFTSSFKVPTGLVVLSDGNKIRAQVESSSKEITAAHTVLAPTFTLSPAKAPPGATVNLKGSNFTPFSPLDSLSVGIMGIRISTPVYTDGDGNLTATFEVPEADGGSHPLIVKVAGQQYSQTFFVENTSSTPQANAYSQAPLTYDVARVLGTLDGNLLRVFYFDNSTKQWSFYDPRPEVARFNTLNKLVEGQPYWIGVREDQNPVVQGRFRTFTSGWNLIVW